MIYDASTQAQELIRIVSTDRCLASSVRSQARELDLVRASNPDLALLALKDLYAATAPTLPMATPTLDYARFVPMWAFWEFNLSDVVRRRHRTLTAYRSYVATSSNPDAQLAADLGPQLLAPAANSWLIPLRNVAGLTGSEVKRELRIDPPPPYVVMVLSVAKMVMSNVQVRDPRGIDAIPHRLLQWRAGDVTDEQIDRDIPVAALERLEWWP